MISVYLLLDYGVVLWGRFNRTHLQRVMDFLQGIRLKRHPYNNWLVLSQGCDYKSFLSSFGME